MDKLQVNLTKQQKYLKKVVRKHLGDNTLDVTLRLHIDETSTRYQLIIWKDTTIVDSHYHIASRNKAIAWIKSLDKETVLWK